MTDKLPPSFASTDALLTAYFAAQDRIKALEEAAREVTSWDWSRLLVDHPDSETVKADMFRLEFVLEGVTP